jgi:hypothetical protein
LGRVGRRGPRGVGRVLAQSGFQLSDPRLQVGILRAQGGVLQPERRQLLQEGVLQPERRQLLQEGGGSGP